MTARTGEAAGSPRHLAQVRGLLVEKCQEVLSSQTQICLGPCCSANTPELGSQVWLWLSPSHAGCPEVAPLSALDPSPCLPTL